MKNLPVTSTRHAPRRRDDAPLDVEPVRTRGPFLSFHYAYTEISARGGTARMRGRTTRFEDGKLSSESFEGTLEPGVYEALVRETQRAFFEQQAAFLKAFLSVLPWGRAKPPRA